MKRDGYFEIFSSGKMPIIIFVKSLHKFTMHFKIDFYLNILQCVHLRSKDKSPSVNVCLGILVYQSVMFLNV